MSHPARTFNIAEDIFLTVSAGGAAITAPGVPPARVAEALASTGLGRLRDYDSAEVELCVVTDSGIGPGRHVATVDYDSMLKS